MSGLGVNQGGLAQRLGVSKGIISEFASGSREPSKDFLFGISKLGISVDWFLTGKGEMFLEKNNAVQIRGRNIIPLTLDDLKNDAEVVMVPFFTGAQASAGPGREIDNIEIMEKPIPIVRKFLYPYNPAVVRALEVRGDSMTKIGLFNEDIVFFMPDDDPGDGVYVISANNKLQVKRLEFDPIGMELRIISENDRYQPRILRGEIMNEIKIEGKVIGWLHKHPY